MKITNTSMTSGARRRAPWTSLPGAILVAAITGGCLAPCAGVRADELRAAPADASASSEPRVRLRVEEWWVAPRNLGLEYAYTGNTGGLSGGGEVVTLVPDRRTVPMLGVGWRLPSNEALEFEATFWELSVGGSSDTGVHPGEVGALLASPDFAIGRSQVDFARAFTQLRATSIDAGFSWSFAPRPPLEMGLSAGLRLFRYEQDTTVVYGSDSTGVTLREFINATTDARGVGPRVAFGFGYRAGSRVALSASAGIAMPVGDLEGLVTDAAFQDADGDGQLELDRATAASRPPTRKSYLQFDGALHAEVRLTRILSVRASYAYAHWAGVAVTQRFVDTVSQNTTLPIETDASFDGAAAGLALEF